MDKKVVDFDKFKEENAKSEVKEAEIDKEVLDIMNDEQIIASITDEKALARFRLNCFCELLSQISALKREVEELSQLISVASADKLTSFFKELQKNVDAEENRIELQKKMGESHKKSKKSAKKVKKA